MEMYVYIWLYNVTVKTIKNYNLIVIFILLPYSLTSWIHWDSWGDYKAFLKEC